MNRAPSKNDTWWAEHQRTCGGSYTKVKEPEDYGKKKTKDKQTTEPKENKKGNIVDLISGTLIFQESFTVELQWLEHLWDHKN